VEGALVVFLLTASPLAAQGHLVPCVGSQENVHDNFSYGGAQSAQPQAPANQRWAHRHPELFGALVGGSIGAPAGAALAESVRGARPGSQAVAVTKGAVFGAALGALIGVALSR